MMHSPAIFAAESWIFTYLLNALWQVPLIFAAAWVMTRMMHHARPAIEHRIWVGALLLEVFLPACRMRVSEMLAAVWSALRWSVGEAPKDGEVRILIGPAHPIGHGWLQLSPLVLTAFATIYAGTMLYFAGRLAWGLWQTRLLAHKAEPSALSGDAAELWNRLQDSSAPGKLTAQIAVSSSIAGPVTIGVGFGFLRALLLLPSGFVTKISPGDFATVLAHEYAHMRRHDFTKNLLYTIASLPIAWHPLLWLTRARVAESREMVCDAWAAKKLTGGDSYARSLLRLASILSTPRRPLTLHAIGIFDANDLERRIMKLTRKSHEFVGARRMAAIAACSLAALAVCTSALALHIEPSPAAVADPPKQMHVKANELQGNLLKQVPPVYPVEAKQAGIQGAVVLNIVVNKEGVPENLSVVSGPRELQKSAIDAVRQWRYKPYLLNGDPIEVTSTVTITYSLGG
jgi:TonB family protein